MEDKSIFRKAFSSSKEKKSDAVSLPSAGVVSSRSDTMMRTQPLRRAFSSSSRYQ